jgi:very-short-patch-repair endonuclease
MKNEQTKLPSRSGKGQGLGQIKRGTTGLIQFQKIKPDKLALAKYFRSHMTYAEKCFWNMARRNQIEGLQFRRQQIIHGFIADFYCNQINLVIEIDGGIHEQQKDYDKLRDHIITACGIKVIRFTNEEVLNKSDWVLQKLKEEIR